MTGLRLMRKAGAGEEGPGELPRQGLEGRSEPDPLEGKKPKHKKQKNPNKQKKTPAIWLEQ